MWLIQPQTPGLTFMHGVFGLDRFPHSLAYGCATQMRNLTGTSSLSKFIASMKTRKKRMYASRVMEVEQATFTPATGGDLT